MNKTETLEFLQRVSWLGSRPGLERITELMGRLGDPQKALKYVHVAGTNGKGSVSAMVSAVLTEAGYTTGLYISPHLQHYNERMKINGAEISDEEFCALTERLKAVSDEMEDKPTEFELITAMALLYFWEHRCDIVVLEVGLGGRLDATNVIPPPEVAVITNLGLEHTEVLGDTIEKIAAEKGGIIKPGCTAVSYDSAPEALRVLDGICREKGVPLVCADTGRIRLCAHSLDGQSFRRDDGEELFIPLLGRHQLHNAALALAAIDALRERGWSITPESIRLGLAAVKWPARFELLAREPLFILDGGHNPQCVRALTDAIAAYLPGERITFLTGILADKDYEAMIDMVSPCALRFVCVTPDNDRALPAHALAALLREKGHEAVSCADMAEAIRACLSYGDAPIVAFGSLYMAGDIRRELGPVYREWLRRKKIRARDSLSAEERAALSRRLVENILSLPEFKQAKTVLLYRAVRGEARLGALETAAEAAEKRLLYPLCTDGKEMIALRPYDETAWAKGYCGIDEPVRERSERIGPEDIDLVICPCTAFDESCARMGMGAGFYDRYLEKCVNANIIAAAFECQKAARIPAAPWDRPMEAVVTEGAVYRRRS